MYRSKGRLFALVGVLQVASPAFAGIAFQTSSIARLGDPAPVPPELVTVFSPSLGDGGQVAFLGDGGLFVQTENSRTLVAAPGNPAPGGGTFTSLSMPVVNALGEVAFAGGVSSAGRSGIFLWSNGSIRPVVQTGDPAPWGGVFGSIYGLGLAMKGAGDDLILAFSGFTYSTIAEEGLFIYSHGLFQRLARRGDDAPGGGTFGSFYFPSVNLSGQVAFYGTLSPTGNGIFLVESDGSITSVARSGDPAPEGGTFQFPALDLTSSQRVPTGDPMFTQPGTEQRREPEPSQLLQAGRELFADGGATYGSFSIQVSLNENGELAFSASTSIFGRGGIFLYSGGQIRRRIREQDPAPGGGVFSYLYNPRLNTAGQIGFLGYTSTGISGIFLFSPEASIVELVRVGGPSPEGDTFNGFSTPLELNEAGQVAFTAVLRQTLGGVYLASAGEIGRVAGQGDLVDRDPIFFDAYPIDINGAGQVLFLGRAFPGGFGLFLGAPVTLVVRVGDPAPGGGVFSYLQYYQVAMNDKRIVFNTYSTMDLVYTMYSFSDGALSRIARAGDPAPGGGVFYYFGSLALSSRGDLALFASTSSPSRTGLYLLSGGVYTLAMGVGDNAPDGGTFSSFDFFKLNDARQIAFYGSVTPPGRSGIFRWSEGVAKPIARTGDAAPGGGMYTFSFPSSFFAPSLNAQGDVAFGAPLSTTYPAVFKFSDDVITLVAGRGDSVQGGGTISGADSAWLNDLGQVAFYASASSGTGIHLFLDGRRIPVARGGDPAPGGGTFSYADVPRLNGQAQIGFVGGTTNGYGLFEASPTN